MPYCENTNNDDWSWVWVFFIFFFLILLICIPFFYWRRSDSCGEVLPAERYAYRPSRVVAVEDIA